MLHTYMYIIDLLEGPHHENVQIQYIESPTVFVHITLSVLKCVCACLLKRSHCGPKGSQSVKDMESHDQHELCVERPGVCACKCGLGGT